MFDAPPPEDGVRGIAAYRETWPPFLNWRRQGASFEIVSLEVSAGEDVASGQRFMIGTPFDPDCCPRSMASSPIPLTTAGGEVYWR